MPAAAYRTDAIREADRIAAAARRSAEAAADLAVQRSAGRCVPAIRAYLDAPGPGTLAAATDAVARHVSTYGKVLLPQWGGRLWDVDESGELVRRKAGRRAGAW